MDLHSGLISVAQQDLHDDVQSSKKTVTSPHSDDNVESNEEAAESLQRANNVVFGDRNLELDALSSRSAACN